MDRARHQFVVFRLWFLTAVCLSLTSVAFPKTLKPTPEEAEEQFADDQQLYEEAVDALESNCVKHERYLREQYNQEKRRINKSLGSLDVNARDKSDELKSAQKRFSKKLKLLNDECHKMKVQLTKRFAPKEPKKRLAKKKGPTEAAPAARKPASIELMVKPPSSTEIKPELPPPSKEPSTWANAFKFHGILSQDTAYRIHEPHEFTKNRSILLLDQTVRFNEDIHFKFSERGFYDTAVTHKNEENKNDPSYVEDDLKSELELRDAYLDYSAGDMDLRLGKQQIVWGEAISVFVADVVNGKDYREFILPDFDQIRLPQWSALASLTRGDVHLEGVVSIPRYNKLPTEDSEFAVPLSSAPGFILTSSSVVKPETKLSNADIGFRFSYLLGGLDTGFFFLRTWDKNPVYFRTVTGTNTIRLEPEYKQQPVFGLTFSKDVRDSIIKGELSVRPQSYFSTQDPLDTDGVVKTTVYEYVLGLDKTFFENWDVNVQVNQRFISGAKYELVNEDATRTLWSAWIKREFCGGKIAPEYLIVSNNDIRDRMHRPKITFKLTNWILLKLGADIFEGKNNRGVFGVYDEKDRGYAKLEFHF